MKKVEKQQILKYFKNCIINESKEDLSIELNLDKSNLWKLFLPDRKIEKFKDDINLKFSIKDIELFFDAISWDWIWNEKSDVLLENIEYLENEKKETFFIKFYSEYIKNIDLDKKNWNNKNIKSFIDFIKWWNNSLRIKIIYKVNNYLYYEKSKKDYLKWEDLEKLFFSWDNNKNLEKIDFFWNEDFLSFYDKNKTEKIYLCLENIITEKNHKNILQPLYFIEVEIEENTKEHFFTISLQETNITFNFFVDYFWKNLFELDNKNHKNEWFQLEKDIEVITNFRSKIDLYKWNLINDFDKNKINKNPCLISANDIWFIKWLIKEYNNLIENEDLINTKDTWLWILFNESEIGKNKIDKITSFTYLNKEQLEAVKYSLENQLSVIVWPPGTWKSQVVINILLNAYINNKTVLFASKNNTAVDTVLNKLSNLNLSYFPFLRLWSKKSQDEWYPKIKNNLLQNIQTYSIKFNDLINIQNKILKFNSEIELIEQIYLEYYESYENLEIILNNYEQWFKDYIYKIWTLDLDFVAIKKFIEQYNKLKNRFYIEIIFENIILLLINIINYIKNTEKEKSKIEILKENILIYLNKELNDILFDYIIWDIDNNNILIKLEKIIELEEINNQKNKISENFKKLSKLKNDITKLNKEIFNFQLKLKDKSLDYISYIISENINKIKPKLSDSIDKIYNIFSFIKEWWNSKDDYLIEKYKKIFDWVKIFITTNLSTSSLPLEKWFFDYLIIDEASQNDIASVIPLLYRTKNVTIIWDPHQLQNIVKLNEKDIIKIFDLNLEKKNLNKKDYIEDFKDIYNFNNSVYSSFESIFKSRLNKNLIVLNEHYRCHDDIINYSNYIISEYNLFPKAYLENKYLKNTSIPIWIYWIKDIINNNDDTTKINEKEAEEIISYLKKILETLWNKVSIWIIAPFRNQVNYINKLIRDNKLEWYYNITVDTVHKFQWDEKDIILFSTVYPNAKSSDFLNNVNLLNVAVSRARNSFLIFWNKQAIKNYKWNLNEELLYNTLINYIESIEKWKKIIENKKFDTAFEKKFFEELEKAKIKFDYQYPIYDGKYNLDFRIKIKWVNNYINFELDGNIHNKQKSYDYTRNKKVEKLWYKVIRFSNIYIKENMSEIIEWLKKICELED